MSSPLCPPGGVALCELEGNSGSQDSKIGDSSIVMYTPSTSNLIPDVWTCRDSLIKDGLNRWDGLNTAYGDFLEFCGVESVEGSIGELCGYTSYSCHWHGGMHYPAYKGTGEFNPARHKRAATTAASRFIGLLESLAIPDLRVVNMGLTCPRPVSDYFGGLGSDAWPGFGKLLMATFYARLCKEYAARFGMDANMHVWKGCDMTSPHPHLDLDVLNVVDVEGALEKFKDPECVKRGEPVTFWHETIKRIWCDTLYECCPGELLRLDSGEALTAENVDVFMQEIPVHKRPKLMHHIRYRRRRPTVDLWDWCAEKGFNADAWEKNFAAGLLGYKNKGRSFGLWRCLRRYSVMPVERPVKRCPVCDDGMSYVGHTWMLPDRLNVITLIKGVACVCCPPPDGLLNWIPGGDV